MQGFQRCISETNEVIHGQVEHQIRFHCLPRDPSSDQFAVRVVGVDHFFNSPLVFLLVLLSQKVAFWELGILDNFGRFVFRHEELRWITQ